MAPHEPPSVVWRRRWRRWRGAPLDYVTSWADARGRAADFADIESYCMFIGYPRSGHSLVGSLVSAHPEAVIGDELDALRYIQLGFRRAQIFSLILRSDRAFSDRGRQAYVHNYDVPGQFQGSFTKLRVIGDKKGGASTMHLRAHPDWLQRLERVVGYPVRYVHVTRNPFDNAAAIFNMPTWGDTFERAVDRYLELCQGVAEFKRTVSADRIFDLRHEDLLVDPAGRLADLLRFLDLEPHADYLAACASILYSSPNKTRTNAPWTPKLRDRIEQAIAQYEFLQAYGWDD